MATNDLNLYQANSVGRWVRRTLTSVAGGLIKTGAIDAPVCQASPAFVSTGTTSVVNTTSATSIVPAGVGSMVIPANSVRAGSRVLLRFAGLSSHASGNFTWLFGFGSSAAGSAAIIGPTGGNYWGGWCELYFASIGATGTVRGIGSGTFSNGTFVLDPSSALGPFDTTAALTVYAAVQHSVADPGNSYISSALSMDFVY